MLCKGISSCAIVFSESESVIIGLVCHLKCLVLSVCDVLLKVLQVNSQHDVISIRQTVKIVVSEPELATQTSEPLFVRFPVTIEVNRAVQPPPPVVMSHNTGIGLPPSGLMVYTPLEVKPSLSSWVQLFASVFRRKRDN